MKRTPLLIAALVPVVAIAGQGMGSQKVDQQELQDDLQVTTILGSEIQSSDGRNVGTVEDVILGRDGKIMSVIVQREGSIGETVDESAQTARDTVASADLDAAGDSETERRDVDYAGADAERQRQTERERDSGMGLDPDRADTMELGDDFAKLDWSNVSYDQETEVLRMSGSESDLQTVQYDQTDNLQAQDEIRASKLVGLEVNLSNEESFGEVEDVMIDPKDGKASAIVVDSMEFFDKQRYAVPVNLDQLDSAQEALTLQYTQQDIESMEEFEMEPTTDQM